MNSKMKVLLNKITSSRLNKRKQIKRISCRLKQEKSNGKTVTINFAKEWCQFYL